MSILKIDNITKRFDNINAVNSFSFESYENEFIILVGPSGCGKSTLLRVIAGLEKPTNGHILIDGNDITQTEPKSRDISMVFQSYALYPNLTVYENIAFPLSVRNIRKDIIMEKVSVIAKKMELTEYLKRKPDTLSGGQRQRVAIGRAMIRNPKVFLMDEPLSNLDASLREKMREELVSLHRQLNAVFVYVTHDQTEAMAMGDRIIVMNHGIVQQIDTPYNIYTFPKNKFVADFIGTPKINFVSRRLFNIVCDRTDLHLNEGILEIAIRPEKISVFNSDKKDNCGTIVNIEMLGMIIVLRVAFGEEILTVCLNNYNESTYKFGDSVRCCSDVKNFLFFDKYGNRIDGV